MLNAGCRPVMAKAAPSQTRMIAYDWTVTRAWRQLVRHGQHSRKRRHFRPEDAHMFLAFPRCAAGRSRALSGSWETEQRTHR
jgi:hypothetical protein